VPPDAPPLDLVTLILNYHDISYLPFDRERHEPPHLRRVEAGRALRGRRPFGHGGHRDRGRQGRCIVSRRRSSSTR
jgi:hypothetical protein